MSWNTPNRDLPSHGLGMKRTRVLRISFVVWNVEHDSIGFALFENASSRRKTFKHEIVLHPGVFVAQLYKDAFAGNEYQSVIRPHGILPFD